MKSSTGCDHCGLRIITLPGQGGKRSLSAAVRRCESLRDHLRKWPGEQQTIVPVGARSARAPSEPMIIRQPPCGSMAAHLEQLGDQPAIEIEVISAIAWIRTRAGEPLDLALDVLRGLREIVCSAPGRCGRAELQCPPPAKDVDVLEHAHIAAVRMPAKCACCGGSSGSAPRR